MKQAERRMRPKRYATLKKNDNKRHYSRQNN